MTIPVFITATSLRADYRPVLISRLGPDVEVVEDTNFEGVTPTLMRALKRGIERSTAEGFDTFCTVEDDAYPVEDFAAHLANAVASQPGQMFSGFNPKPIGPPRQMIPDSLSREYHWAYFWRFGAVMLVWPVQVAQGFLDWMADHPEFITIKDYTSAIPSPILTSPVDSLILYYLACTQNLCPWHMPRPLQPVPDFNWELRVLHTVPSLVEHIGDDSTLRMRDGNFLPRSAKIHALYFSSTLIRERWRSEVYESGWYQK